MTNTLYFYFRDHLGSTLSVTDSVGNYVQQVEYTPWGEVFVEQYNGNSGYTTPYLFNGKELDEETGLYYYGARYYDPKMSVWYSTDPMEMDYPWVTTYGYCLGNPVIYVDYKGEKIVSPNGYNAVDIKNGRFIFTKYATPSIKRVVNSLKITQEGRKMLTQAVQSDILVKINISKTTKRHKVSETQVSYTYGETVQGNFNPNDNYGRYKTKVGKNDKYGIRMAYVTIYEGTIIEDAKTSNAKHSGLTLDQAIGAVAGHELVHATDQDEINKDITSEMEYRKERVDKEDKANKIEMIIINQSKQLNK